MNENKNSFHQGTSTMALPTWLKNLPVDDIKMVADKNNLDQNLVLAIVATESGGKSYSFRFEPHFKWLFKVDEFARKTGVSRDSEENGQKTSWGLMQVMGAVARELGFEGLLPELCKPELGLEFGCKKIQKCLERYHGDLENAISAYNAGTAKKLPNGNFANQDYVSKVTGRMTELKAAR